MSTLKCLQKSKYVLHMKLTLCYNQYYPNKFHLKENNGDYGERRFKSEEIHVSNEDIAWTIN